MYVYIYIYINNLAMVSDAFLILFADDANLFILDMVLKYYVTW